MRRRPDGPRLQKGTDDMTTLTSDSTNIARGKRPWIVDLVAYMVLTFAIGIAVSVVLAGAVLLLTDARAENAPPPAQTTPERTSAAEAAAMDDDMTPVDHAIYFLPDAAGAFKLTIRI